MRRAISISLFFLHALSTAGPAADPVRSSTVIFSRDSNGGSSPSDFVRFGDSLFFVADDGIYGRELWRIDRDGSVAMAGDFLSGPEGAEPNHLTPIDDGLYFLARSGVGTPGSRDVLWQTLGSASRSRPIVTSDVQVRAQPGSAALWGAGDVLLLITPSDTMGREPLLMLNRSAARAISIPIDTIPGTWGGIPEGQEMYDTAKGTCFFVAQDSVNSLRYLWRAGPESGDAVRLLENDPGFGFPMVLKALGERLYLSASHAKLGVELWVSDGTDAGTLFLKDINPGEASSFPAQFQEMNGTVYFQADDGLHGKELWRTDGTGAGTWLVADINPGPASSAPYQLWSIGDLLLFAATTEAEGTELWRSDGTGDGTSLVLDIYPGSESSNLYAPAVLEHMLLFAAHHPQSGEELWRSDGTAEGTFLVRDIAPGPDISEPFNLTPFGDAVYFSADDGDHGTELWRTDGTAAGTRLLADINAASHVAVSSNPAHLTACGENVFFVADDVVHGAELWRNHVPSGETALVQDIAPGPAHADPQELVALGDTLFFSAAAGNSTRQLWRTRGAAESTKRIPLHGEAREELAPISLCADGDTLCITADSTDGEASLFRLADDTRPPASLGSAREIFGEPGRLAMALVDHRVYLTCASANGYRFAVLDSSASAPRMLGLRVPRNADWQHFQRWYDSQDSTEAGLDRDVLCCYLALPGMAKRQAVMGGQFYFAALAPETGVEIWKAARGISDAGLLKDCFEGRGSGGPSWLAASGGSLFFSAEHAGKGREVWFTDGTTENTYVLDEPHTPGPAGAAPRELVAWQGQVWFTQAGNDLHQGRRTIVACSEHDTQFHIFGNPLEFNHTAYDPRDLTAHGGYLYFSAESPAAGRELWRFHVGPSKLELIANVAAEAGYRENVCVPIHIP